MEPEPRQTPLVPGFSYRPATPQSPRKTWTPAGATGNGRSRGATIAHAPLSVEGRRRLVERCKTRPIAHVAAENSKPTASRSAAAPSHANWARWGSTDGASSTPTRAEPGYEWTSAVRSCRQSQIRLPPPHLVDVSDRVCSGLDQEVGEHVGESFGLVLGDEGGRVGDLDQPTRLTE